MPLKLVHINRCPVLAPLNVLRAQDRERIGLDLDECRRNQDALVQGKSIWQDKLAPIYAEESFTASEDPEQQLYDGFIGDRDRRLCEQVRLSDPQRLAKEQWPFDDPRLPELLFRYRARNFPETLTPLEQEQWRNFCRQRLSSAEFGAPNTLANFEEALAVQLVQSTPENRALLEEWRGHAQQLRQRYSL
ncbi:Exodeoxyribonuclease I [compost metagenome]